MKVGSKGVHNLSCSAFHIQKLAQQPLILSLFHDYPTKVIVGKGEEGC